MLEDGGNKTASRSDERSEIQRMLDRVEDAISRQENHIQSLKENLSLVLSNTSTAEEAQKMQCGSSLGQTLWQFNNRLCEIDAQILTMLDNCKL